MKSKLLLGFVLACAFSFSQTPPNAGSYSIQNLASSLDLENPGSSTTQDKQMIQSAADGDLSQVWNVTKYGTTGLYMIQNAASKLYLRDPGTGKLVQEWYGNSTSKRWLFQAVAGGWLIKNQGTGRVFDNLASTADGAVIATSVINGTPGQTWSLTLPGAPPPPPPPPPTVNSLTLMSTNGDTPANQPISGYAPMLQGAVLDLASLPAGMSIRADASTATQSVLFELDGATTVSPLDSTGPIWSFCGDNDALQTYAACLDSGNLTVGRHVLTVIPYSGPNGAGSTAGATYTLNFSVINSGTPPPPLTPAITSVTLMSTSADSPANQLIAGYAPITQGTTLNLATLPAGLNIRADATATGSVLFALDGTNSLDAAGPLFSLCGDDDSAQTYTACSNLTVGPHVLTAIPYGGSDGSGTAGPTYSLNFNVINVVTSPPPPPVVMTSRFLYAVNESGTKGSISIYNIDTAHSLVQTIATVPNVTEVQGAVASPVTGKFYVTYYSGSTPKIFAVDLYTNQVLWNVTLTPGVDRLAISPDGQLLYVPTSENLAYNYIQVVDANTGALVQKVTIPSTRSHDTQYPLSGPIFQETKATDGTGRHLYKIDPTTYAVTTEGTFHDFLGPFAVDALSRYAVADVNNIFGFQVLDMQTNIVSTAKLPYTSNTGLPHGIGWTPNQSEVWQVTSSTDPHVYVWDMTNPMIPVFKQRLNLDNGGAHWLTFDIQGDYAYIAPSKDTSNGTDVFNVATHTLVGKIASSEDMLEIDFDANGKITQVGNQFGIGR